MVVEVREKPRCCRTDDTADFVMKRVGSDCSRLGRRIQDWIPILKTRQ
jgi:hypothetical protein